MPNPAGRPNRAKVDESLVEQALADSDNVVGAGDELDALKAQLANAVRMMEEARQGRSYTALRGMAKDVRELQDKIRQVVAERAAEESDDDDFDFDELAREYATWPEHIRDRLLKALGSAMKPGEGPLH